MSSTDNPPSLELSDIMHHMSPSPVPPEDPGSTMATTMAQQTNIYEERAESPDRPSETDVLGFRRRLEEMGLLALKRHNGFQENAISGSSVTSTSSRERELLDMVGVEASFISPKYGIDFLSRFCGSPTRYQWIPHSWRDRRTLSQTCGPSAILLQVKRRRSESDGVPSGRAGTDPLRL